MTHFIIAYHISLAKVQTYFNNNLLILDVKQLNKIIKLYYFHTLKPLWDGQWKIKMYYGMSKVQKQLSGKRSIENSASQMKIMKQWIPQKNIFPTNDHATICGALRDLVPFVQLKKREKHPWRSVTCSKVAGLSLQLY